MPEETTEESTFGLSEIVLWLMILLFILTVVRSGLSGFMNSLSLFMQAFIASILEKIPGYGYLW